MIPRYSVVKIVLYTVVLSITNILKTIFETQVHVLYWRNYVKSGVSLYYQSGMVRDHRPVVRHPFPGKLIP